MVDFIKVYNDEIKAIINVKDLHVATILDDGNSIKLFYNTGNDIAFPFIGPDRVNEMFSMIEEAISK